VKKWLALSIGFNLSRAGEWNFSHVPVNVEHSHKRLTFHCSILDCGDAGEGSGFGAL
jgi:hypothetical protein